MKFELRGTEIAKGRVVYSEEDRGFQTHPIPPHAGSIQVNEVELLIGESGKIVGISGYCPRDGWNKGTLTYPQPKLGVVLCPEGLDADGIPIRYNKSERWKVVYDCAGALLSMFPSHPVPATATVEILEGLVLGSDDGRLTQIWIRVSPI